MVKIEYKDIYFNVYFEYNEEEKQTLEHPYSLLEITEITQFRNGNEDFIEFLTDEDIERVKLIILETE